AGAGAQPAAGGPDPALALARRPPAEELGRSTRIAVEPVDLRARRAHAVALLMDVEGVPDDLLGQVEHVADRDLATGAEVDDLAIESRELGRPGGGIGGGGGHTEAARRACA